MSADIKRRLLECGLLNGSVLVRVDGAACTGLPSAYCMDRGLLLRLGHHLEPDMRIVCGDLGFEATCTFAGIDHRVQVPWRALFAMGGEDTPRFAAQWPDDVPKTGTMVDPPSFKPRGGLKLVS